MRRTLRQGRYIATPFCRHSGFVAIDSCRSPSSAKARVLQVSTTTCCFSPARLSSTELYAEQYVAWHLTHAPGVAAKTTLTRTDVIGF